MGSVSHRYRNRQSSRNSLGAKQTIDIRVLTVSSERPVVSARTPLTRVFHQKRLFRSKGLILDGTTPGPPPEPTSPLPAQLMIRRGIAKLLQRLPTEIIIDILRLAFTLDDPVEVDIFFYVKGREVPAGPRHNWLHSIGLDAFHSECQSVFFHENAFFMDIGLMAYMTPQGKQIWAREYMPRPDEMMYGVRSIRISSMVDCYGLANLWRVVKCLPCLETLTIDTRQGCDAERVGEEGVTRVADRALSHYLVKRGMPANVCVLIVEQSSARKEESPRHAWDANGVEYVQTEEQYLLDMMESR